MGTSYKLSTVILPSLQIYYPWLSNKFPSKIPVAHIWKGKSCEERKEYNTG
jgi:hypothetical protein